MALLVGSAAKVERLRYVIVTDVTGVAK